MITNAPRGGGVIVNAVVCSDLWKRYALRRRHRTLRDVLGSSLVDRRTRNGGSGPEEFWALREISVAILQGEALGLIGRNGSGKSTMLKLIAGVTWPTRGLVEVYGRVGALIEVGTGLHPELTGRENIFLYGTILGLSRQEIRRRFEQIVEFAEIDQFLETPVKRYSSGMRVRLGFAVAAHLDPQILLVDEALSVGDVAFQRKCVRYIHTLREAGTTIIFVSHELPIVERVCQRVAWIDAGQIRELGPSGEVVQHYLESVEEATLMQSRPATGASAVRRDVVPGDLLTDHGG